MWPPRNPEMVIVSLDCDGYVELLTAQDDEGNAKRGKGEPHKKLPRPRKGEPHKGNIRKVTFKSLRCDLKVT